MMKMIGVEQCNSELRGSYDLFLCSSSFESRSCVLPCIVDFSKYKRALLFANKNYYDYINDNLETLKTHFKDKASLVEISSFDPIFTADNIMNQLESINEQQQVKRVLIDITTFTHETLLILMAVLRNKFQHIQVTCCYINASDYSIDQTGKTEKWLSTGIKEVRSILGYIGDVRPSRRTHLMMIVGYEYKRASKIIDAIEADSLSLGYAKPESYTADKNQDANEHFKRLLKDLHAYYAEIPEFMIPCNDPYETCSVVLEEAARIGNESNLIVVPMNNKISTVGIALACFKNESIQLCYAPALTYNYLHYSDPGKTCYIFDLDMNDYCKGAVFKD